MTFLLSAVVILAILATIAVALDAESRWFWRRYGYCPTCRHFCDESDDAAGPGEGLS